LPTNDFAIHEYERYNQEEDNILDSNENGNNVDYDIFRFIDSSGYSFNEGYQAYSKKILEFITSKVKEKI
jgi:hypothetical protein